MRFQKCILAVLLAIALSGTSCSSKKQILSHEVNESSLRTDSVSLVMARITRPIPIPASRATLRISFDSIAALPTGAGYTARQGQATVTVSKTEGGMIEASANCDSLTLLVDELRTEVYHLNKEKTDIKSELREQKMIEVNRLTSWQSFQIWTGRICLAILVILAIIKIKTLKII